MKAEYIDHMGTDLTVANAARVSHNKQTDWEVSHSVRQELKEKDKKLVTFLTKEDHFTPFTHPQITMRETVPIFVARQRFKHVVGFSYNEVSRRYVDSEPEFYEPEVWRKRAENVKQGSSDEALTHFVTSYDGQDIDSVVSYVQDQCDDLYYAMVEDGVCPEQARMVLPQSMYTEYYVTGSLAAWARAYNLRSDPHAQREIQDLAEQWDTIIRPLFPVSWSALVGEKEKRWVCPIGYEGCTKNCGNYGCGN